MDAEMTATLGEGGVEDLFGVRPGNGSPDSLSAYALSLAAQKDQLPRALLLCREAVRRAPEEPSHYLHLGKIYLLAGKKHLALHAFRKGLGHDRGTMLLNEIRRLGFRREPIFPFLGRKHRLNRFLGRLLARMGWR
jgi:hypothetical protein